MLMFCSRSEAQAPPPTMNMYVSYADNSDIDLCAYNIQVSGYTRSQLSSWDIRIVLMLGDNQLREISRFQSVVDDSQFPTSIITFRPRGVLPASQTQTYKIRMIYSICVSGVTPCAVNQIKDISLSDVPGGLPSRVFKPLALRLLTPFISAAPIRQSQLSSYRFPFEAFDTSAPASSSGVKLSDVITTRMRLETSVMPHNNGLGGQPLQPGLLNGIDFEWTYTDTNGKFDFRFLRFPYGLSNSTNVYNIRISLSDGLLGTSSLFGADIDLHHFLVVMDATIGSVLVSSTVSDFNINGPSLTPLIFGQSYNISWNTNISWPSDSPSKIRVMMINTTTNQAQELSRTIQPNQPNLQWTPIESAALPEGNYRIVVEFLDNPNVQASHNVVIRPAFTIVNPALHNIVYCGVGDEIIVNWVANSGLYPANRDIPLSISLSTDRVPSDYIASPAQIQSGTGYFTWNDLPVSITPSGGIITIRGVGSYNHFFGRSPVIVLRSSCNYGVLKPIQDVSPSTHCGFIELSDNKSPNIYQSDNGVVKFKYEEKNVQSFSSRVVNVYDWQRNLVARLNMQGAYGTNYYTFFLRNCIIFRGSSTYSIEMQDENKVDYTIRFITSRTMDNTAPAFTTTITPHNNSGTCDRSGSATATTTCNSFIISPSYSATYYTIDWYVSGSLVKRTTHGSGINAETLSLCRINPNTAIHAVVRDNSCNELYYWLTISPCSNQSNPAPTVTVNATTINPPGFLR